MSDKRSVATDALETLGTIIGEGAGRDAIHLAVEPVIAAHRLLPAQDVGLLEDGKAGTSLNPVGIVDPFLKRAVKPGEKFWLVVYPRQITSLRHVWEHPAFEKSLEPIITEEHREQAKRVAERLTGVSVQWLKEFCEKGDGPDYETLMDAINNGGSSSSVDSDGDYSYGITINGDYIQVNGADAHGDIPPEFWDHVENVTGKKQTLRPDHFFCSC